LSDGAEFGFMFAPLIRFALTTAVLAATGSFAGCNSMPKDAELVALLRSHRDAFERLAVMGIEDAGRFSSISVEVLNKEPLTDGLQALNPERRGEYKRLLASIRSDLMMGIDGYTRSVSFSYWGGGTGLSIGRSWEKGIAYLSRPDRVGRIVDGLNEPPSEDDVYLLPIEGQWYIYYSQLD
jgi:hypothetical protein